MLGGRGQGLQVVRPDQTAQIGTRRAGGHPGLDKCCQPGILDLDERGQQGRVAHQRARAVVAGPEQVAHWPG